MFLVMRTHTVSHMSRRVLWQVISRPFDTRPQAEAWNTFYTPVEAFSTPEYREARRLNLAALDPDLGFLERDLEADATWPLITIPDTPDQNHEDPKSRRI